MGNHIGVYKATYITCTSSSLTNLNFSLVLLKFLFYLIFRSNLYILDYIVKSRRKGFELEPWFLPRFPAHIFSLWGFFGQVFSGLRLTAFTSVCKR